MMADPVLNYLTALGIGLLIGIERERRKGEGPARAAAGLRTFTIAALLGALAWQMGQIVLLVPVLLIMGGLAALSYRRSAAQDPGLTTETALVVIPLLGALSMENPTLAAGLGVVVAALLAARTALHRFARSILSEEELQDAILLAAAGLVILPLAPDRPMGPFGAINPHTIWLIVVTVLGISAVGHAAGRLIGPRAGLPLAGLMAGFVSSSATISAMGSRARTEPLLHAPAVAGALLSNLTTFIQLALLLWVVSPALLHDMALPLFAGGGTAALYGAAFTWRAGRTGRVTFESRQRPLNPLMALAFAGIVTLVAVTVAALHDWLGEPGIMLGAAIAGLADAHAGSASIAAMSEAGNLPLVSAAAGILAAATTNTLTKIALARTMGGPGYAREVIPGLLLAILAAWAGAWLEYLS